MSVKQKQAETPKGARIVGAHLEGPFINPARRGVHPIEYLATPSISSFRELVDGFERLIRIMTLAPELPGAHDVVKECVRMGIIPSMGHTDATFEEAQSAIDLGVTHCTHTFNAMPSIQNRQPGPVVAALLSHKVKCEIIADGIHVDPNNIRLLVDLKKTDRTILTSDSVKPTGTAVQEFEMGGVKGNVHDGAAYTSEGKLCGSLLTIDQAVRNMAAWTNYSLPDILTMATKNPAQQLGVTESVGSLAEGKRADLAVLDRNLKVVATFVDGVQVYSRNAVGAER